MLPFKISYDKNNYFHAIRSASESSNIQHYSRYAKRDNRDASTSIDNLCITTPYARYNSVLELAMFIVS